MDQVTDEVLETLEAPYRDKDDPPFSALLPHHFLLDEDGSLLLSTPRYTNPTLDLGCAWDVVPRNVETLSEAECLDLARMHQGLYRNLPKHASVQTIMQVVPSTQAPPWRALREGYEAHWAVQSQQEALARGLPHQQLDPPLEHRLREVLTTVSLRLPVPDAHPRTAALLQAALQLRTEGMTSLAEGLSRHLAEAREGLQSRATSLQETLRRAGHQVTRLDGPGLTTRLARSLDPWRPDAPLFVPDLPLARQVASRYLRTMPGGMQQTTDGAYEARVFTLSRLIPRTYPGILCAPRAPAESVALALWEQWDGPFTVVMNVSRPDQRLERMRLNWKRFMAFLHRFNIFGASSPENEALNQELETFLRDFFTTGGQMLLARIHLVLWGRPVQFRQRLDGLLEWARKLDIEFTAEPDLGSTLWLQTLPLGYDATYPAEFWLKRGRRTPIGNAGQLTPLFGGFRGTATATMGYVSSRGETVGLDLFDQRPNPHVFVSGMSGGGKSYWINYMANQVLPLGASMVILDHLPSYQELCAAHGGRYLSMSVKRPISFNPFYGPLDEQHLVFVHACLTRMISGGGLGHLSRDHVSILAAALTHFADTYDQARGEAQIGLFRREVLLAPAGFTSNPDEQRMSLDIARWLRMYCETGVYAGFFDRPSQLRLDDGLTVIETAGLEDAPELKGHLLFCLLHLLTQFYMDPVRLLRKKFLVCDETLFLLKEERSADVLEQIELTFRKLNTSAIFLAQQADQLTSPAGQAILKGSPTTVFLQQTPEEVEAMAALFAMTPAERDLFKRAALHDGWSTFFLRLPNKQGGLVRLVPDAATDFLASQSTTGRQVRATWLAASGGDMQQAVLQFTTQTYASVA